jgi:hypothetical protein
MEMEMEMEMEPLLCFDGAHTARTGTLARFPPHTGLLAEGRTAPLSPVIRQQRPSS